MEEKMVFWEVGGANTRRKWGPVQDYQRIREKIGGC